VNLKGGAIAVSCVGGSRVLDFRCCKLCRCFPYVYQSGNDICVHQLKNGFLISQENTSSSSSSSSFSVFVDGYLTWSWSQVPVD